MVSADTARAIALALPGSVEMAHHGLPSFRTRGRIFATLPDPGHLNVMLDETGTRAMAAALPGVCAERWWGRRLAALTIDLAAADEALVREMLSDAWRRRGGEPSPIS